MDTVRIEISFPANGVSVHQVRNFGETLFEVFRNDRKVTISLEQVDAATDRLFVEAYSSKKNIPRVVEEITWLLEQELLLSRSAVTIAQYTLRDLNTERGVKDRQT